MTLSTTKLLTTSSHIIRLSLFALCVFQYFQDPRGLIWMLPLSVATLTPLLFPHFPPLHDFLFSAVFAIGTLGVFFQAYETVLILDDTLHLLTPAVITLLFSHIFSLVLEKDNKKTVLLAVISIAVLWELFEWTLASYLAHTIPFTLTIKDTLFDLILAFVAVNLVLYTPEYFSLKT